MSDVLITLRDHGWQAILLRAAWGPRRITSKTRYGTVENSYPSCVTASHRLWLQWLRRGLADWLAWRVTVVTPQRKALARIHGALRHQPRSEIVPQGMTPDIVALLEAERHEHRAARRFVEADAIRDRLLAAGISVQDKPIKQRRPCVVATKEATRNG